MDNLEKLNQLKVVDYDVDSDRTMIYIHVEDTASNREVLEDLGATDYDFEVMLAGLEVDDLLDITEFGFNKLKAGFWSRNTGFTYSE